MISLHLWWWCMGELLHCKNWFVYIGDYQKMDWIILAKTMWLVCLCGLMRKSIPPTSRISARGHCPFSDDLMNMHNVFIRYVNSQHILESSIRHNNTVLLWRVGIMHFTVNLHTLGHFATILGHVIMRYIDLSFWGHTAMDICVTEINLESRVIIGHWTAISGEWACGEL